MKLQAAVGVLDVATAGDAGPEAIVAVQGNACLVGLVQGLDGILVCEGAEGANICGGCGAVDENFAHDLPCGVELLGAAEPVDEL